MIPKFAQEHAKHYMEMIPSTNIPEESMKQNEEREYLEKALEVAHTLEINLVENNDIMARANLGYLIGYLEGGLKHYEK